MSTYIMVGVATFVVVGGLLFLALCMGKRNKKRRNKDDSEDESLLSSDDGKRLLSLRAHSTGSDLASLFR